MSPLGRKVALVAHIGCSAGWLGAVLTSLVLAIVGVSTRDSQVMGGAYLLLEVVGWYALVPLSFASLLTGLLQGLGTKWGLFRHYWIITKLALNIVAIGVLLLYMQTLVYLADVASSPAFPTDVDRMAGMSPVVHGAAAVALLLAALVLSVIKPRGLTAHGQRRTVPMTHDDRALKTARLN